MSQTRRWSLIEAAASTLIGLAVAQAANLTVLPLFGFHPSFGEAAGMTVIFTLISLARGYAVRRLFVWIETWRSS